MNSLRLEHPSSSLPIEVSCGLYKTMRCSQEKTKFKSGQGHPHAGRREGQRPKMTKRHGAECSLKLHFTQLPKLSCLSRGGSSSLSSPPRGSQTSDGHKTLCRHLRGKVGAPKGLWEAAEATHNINAPSISRESWHLLQYLPRGCIKSSGGTRKGNAFQVEMPSFC